MQQLSDYNVTVEELAVKLGYTTQRIRTLAQEGKIPALKRFRRWMFCEAEILECLRNKSVSNINPVASAKTLKRDNDPDNGIANAQQSDPDGDLLR